MACSVNVGHNTMTVQGVHHIMVVRMARSLGLGIISAILSISAHPHIALWPLDYTTDVTMRMSFLRAWCRGLHNHQQVPHLEMAIVKYRGG